jgi:mono/diheme cytochrome c family protein
MTTRLVLATLAAGAVSLCLADTARAQPPADLGPAVKQIFQANCFECHGGALGAQRGVKVLDRKVLVETKRVIVPREPAKSKLFARISAKPGAPEVMPPEEEGRRHLTPQEIDTVKSWILAGAPDFDAVAAARPADLSPAGIPDRPPATVAGIPVKKKVLSLPPPDPQDGPQGLGIDYVLGQILRDVRTLDGEARRKVRYFSLAHLVTAGAKEDELEQHRQALAKAINHLHRQAELVQPVAVDRRNTIYRIDLRQLGWDRPVLQPAAGGGSLNAFDLVLLEYPYGMIYNNTGVYTSLVRDYIAPSQMARPVPFVRGDWFVSRATLPPLYYDLLNLPTTLKELERELGVDALADIAGGRAFRAGMVQSKVSRNNRVVERHTGTFGYYWRSYDYASSVDTKSIVTDPVNLRPDGGEMIFALPDGLQGYFIVNKDGKRLDEAPQNIVEDTTAGSTVEGLAVRDGLSCIRCHERGMKSFTDDIRPIALKLPESAGNRQRTLDLYPEQETMNRFLKQDEDRFVKAMAQLLGKEQGEEPLTPVARRFEGKFDLAEAAAELGRTGPDGLDQTFGLPQFIKAGLSPLTRTEKGKVARDSWETHFGDVARELKLGFPLVPLDSGIRLEEQPLKRPFRFNTELNKKAFNRGDDLEVFLITDRNVFVEVLRTDTEGKQTVLTAAGTRVAAQESTQVPLQAGRVKVSARPGKEQITLLLSDEQFAAGEVLSGPNGTSRVIHRAGFEQAANGEITLLPGLDPARTIKKTFVVEVK